MKNRRDLFKEPTSRQHDATILQMARDELKPSANLVPWKWIFLRLATGTIAIGAIALFSRQWLLRQEYNSSLNDFDTIESYAELENEFEALEGDDDFEIVEMLDELEQWEES